MLALACVAIAAPLIGQGAAPCSPHWLPVAPGKGPQSFNGYVYCALPFDDGSGEALYIGGGFSLANGSTHISGIARWNGKAYSDLGVADNSQVLQLTVFDDGNGPALYACGIHGSWPDKLPARWNGSSWTSLAGSTTSSTRCMHVYDDGSGPSLYVGGGFTQIGGIAANRIARWDGQQWSALGAGFDQSPQYMATFDDGSGPKLYVGGNMVLSGTDFVGQVARWNGVAWEKVGVGIGGAFGNGYVEALELYDDGMGGGPALYAGGNFHTTDGVAPIRNLARWNGTQWNRVGDLPVGAVFGMKSFDDGSGANASLFISGSVAYDGTNLVDLFNRWDGGAWHHLDPLASYLFISDGFAAWDDSTGAGPTLYCCGNFSSKSMYGDVGLLRWGGCQATSSVVPVPGCNVAPATLSTPHPFAAIDRDLEIKLAAPGVTTGVAPLYVGSLGTSAQGCGLVLAGIGELLLAPFPAPYVVGTNAVLPVKPSYLINVPDDASLVGQSVALQSVVLGFQPSIVQLSAALSVTIGS